jgi:hypothetical protein
VVVHNREEPIAHGRHELRRLPHEDFGTEPREIVCEQGKVCVVQRQLAVISALAAPALAKSGLGVGAGEGGDEGDVALPELVQFGQGLVGELETSPGIDLRVRVTVPTMRDSRKVRAAPAS